MSNARIPTATDVLRSLRLLRSTQASERIRGITILSAMRDDPRVYQVFEHLYERDPDPAVRQAAWRALNQAGPSIPAPGPAKSHPEEKSPMSTTPQRPDPPPAAEPRKPAEKQPAARAASARQPRSQPPSPGQSARQRAASRPRRAGASSHTLFLLNPANAKFVARETKRISEHKRGSRIPFVIALVVLLVTAALWVLALPELLAWYDFRQDGVTTEGTLTSLRITNDDRFYATYAFASAPEGAEPRQSEQRITENQYNTWLPAMIEWQAEGDPVAVEVEYLPDDPAESRLTVDNPDDLIRDRLTIGAIGMSIVFLLLVILWVVRRQRPYLLARGRRLLRGEMVSCAGREDDDGDFKLMIEFRFRSPSGSVIVHRASQIRNDLRRMPLPGAGTPVAIYYRNDRAFRLL